MYCLFIVTQRSLSCIPLSAATGGRQEYTQVTRPSQDTHPSLTHSRRCACLSVGRSSAYLYSACKHELAQLYSALCCSIPPSFIYLSPPPLSRYELGSASGFFLRCVFPHTSKMSAAARLTPLHLSHSACLTATDRYLPFYDTTRLKYPRQASSWRIWILKSELKDVLW